MSSVGKFISAPLANLKTENKTFCRICLAGNPKGLLSLLKSKTPYPLEFNLVLDFFNLRTSCYPALVCEKCFKKFAIALSLKIQCESSCIALNKLVGVNLKKLKRKNKESTVQGEASSDKTCDIEMEKNEISQRENKVSQVQSDDSLKSKKQCLDDGILEKPFKKLHISNDDVMSINKNPLQNEKNYTISTATAVCNKKTSDDNRLLKKQYVKPIKDVCELSSSENKEFKCSKCSKSFPDAKSLKGHNSEHKSSNVQVVTLSPSEMKELKCSLCNKCFLNEASLKKHKLKHIKKYKRFMCPQCAKSYSEKKPLKYREKFHSGDQPHVCAICGDSKRLIKTHSDTKTFSCQICHKNFSNPGYLEQHLKTHADNPLFTCKVCSYQCTVESAFNNHVKSVHPDNTSTISSSDTLEDTKGSVTSLSGVECHDDKMEANDKSLDIVKDTSVKGMDNVSVIENTIQESLSKMSLDPQDCYLWQTCED